jgi:RuvB-like protein 2
MDPECLDLMGIMAQETSLRYALNLIAPSQLIALRRKSPTVSHQDIRAAYAYYIDVQRSTAYAKETAALMFGEEEVGTGAGAGAAAGAVNGSATGNAMDISA